MVLGDSNITHIITGSDSKCDIGSTGRRFQHGYFGGDITCNNLTVNGTSTTLNVSTLEIEDTTIHCGHNNPADILDSAYFMEMYHLE